MTFDIHMQRLTAAVSALTAGRTTATYQAVRSCLKACISADSELAVPAVLDSRQEEQAMPGMTKGSNGFMYYVAYTSQEQAEAAPAEVMISVPIVNFLAIIHSNRQNPELGGMILNPQDRGGCAVTLSECMRMLDELTELLDRNSGDPENQTVLQ